MAIECSSDRPADSQRSSSWGWSGLACLVLLRRRARAQDDAHARKGRSNWSTRMCFAPARIRAIFRSPTRPARASRTRSPNFSRASSSKSVAYTFYPGATGFIRNTLNAASMRRRPGDCPGRRHRSADQSLLPNQLCRRVPQGRPARRARFAERSAPKDGEDRHHRGNPAGDLSCRQSDCSAKSNPTRWSSTLASIPRPTR